MSKVSWFSINERLLELERMSVKDERWIEEWNGLIDMTKKIAGCLRRTKYEESKAEKEGKRGKEKRRKGKDVAVI